MNSINITYNNLLGNEKPENFKRYLKTLLEENVQNVVLLVPQQGTSRKEFVPQTYVELQLIASIIRQMISTLSFKLPK